MNKKMIGAAFALCGSILWTGEAAALVTFENVSYTSNSVTFTINGDLTGYTAPSGVYNVTGYNNSFSLNYIGDIWAGVAGYTQNTSWSQSVFDGQIIGSVGNTGEFAPYGNYTWSHYLADLSGAVATNRTITVTFGDNYLNPLASSGTIEFLWGLGGSGKNTVLGNYNVSPVPEPETYAMLLAGLGLIGFQLRRKSRQSAPSMLGMA